MMPVDAWRARLKAELGAGSSGIDIAQWSVGMAGWMSPHLLDHEPLVAKMAARDPRSTGPTSSRHQARGQL
jgi:hypothetical protein